MPKTQTILELFVASPGDVLDERKIVEEVVEEFNVTWGGAHNVRVDLVRWETHTRPGFGDDAQDVINQQIGDHYDIFLGIMWGRFGSPTHRATSGTEEEFQRAYARLRASPGSVQIMFYFKDAGIPPSRVDPKQLAKVLEFKERMSSELGGYYHQFENAEEFRTKVRVHLSRLVQDFMKDSPPPPSAPSARVPPASGPLANFSALTDNDYDEGIFDLVERAIEFDGHSYADHQKYDRCPSKSDRAGDAANQSDRATRIHWLNTRLEEDIQ